MSTPAPATPKGARNARRTPRRAVTPKNTANNHIQNPRDSNHSTPPRNTPRNASPDSGMTTEGSINVPESQSKKNKSTFKKKNKDPSKPSPLPNGNTATHRHTSSQPSVTSPLGLKNSPHYAGPTFHASPAPSALPIPTFFSKSVPDGEIAKSMGSDYDEVEDDESPDSEVPASTPSKTRAFTSVGQDNEPTSSPLDFLFKAAREAKVAKQNSDAETPSGTSSPLSFDAKAKSGSLPADGTPGGMFPLELENTDNQKMEIGPSFATPYKDRMNALRSAPVHSDSNSDSSEEENRKAKTEALKSLLLNPRPQRPLSASPLGRDASKKPNSNHAMPDGARNGALPPYHASGPPTPASFDQQSQNKSRNSSIAHQYLTSVCNNAAQTKRMPSSNLRQELSQASSTTSPPSSMERGHFLRTTSAQPSFQAYQPQSPNVVSPSPNRAAPTYSPSPSPFRAYSSGAKISDTRKMEEDLRRILRIEPSDSRCTNGVGNSIA